MIDLHNIDWHNIHAHIPFIGLIAKGAEATPFSTRMIEAAIIAGCTAGLSMYVTLPKVEEKVSNVSRQVEYNHQETVQQIDKIVIQVDRLNSKVDANTLAQHAELNEIRKEVWKGNN
jgi:hypothetical protein